MRARSPPPHPESREGGGCVGLLLRDAKVVRTSGGGGERLPALSGTQLELGEQMAGLEGSEPPGIGNSRISGPSRVAMLGFVLMHF